MEAIPGKELFDILTGGLSILYKAYEGQNIVEIAAVESISGMSKNEGIPTQINVTFHRAGKKLTLNYALIVPKDDPNPVTHF